ncbi:Hydroxyethylthiazole kinase [Moraxella lacunata]|uniref:Hydroxyethylthiazole kinase n=1 Tax=Moraxella lacunata TaxID=477 RepID=A0A1V4H2T4_MORLA|nr:hydroxyethylthiazole kinase [Moraxella lacunata]OPH38686.1 hydroxyethylthiazole kinase [Moraxella lacunata]STZ01052.1 Hydroxyethylthiazole kinase [Moraxella lacunata]
MSYPAPTDFYSSRLPQIRTQNPLIHNITNIVSAHFSANGLLALGASPIMSGVYDEMRQLAGITHALTLNLGAPSREQVRAMIEAGQAMNELGKPVVLDPVGVGASSYRQDVTHEILANVKVALIRGNAGEMAQLAGVEWSSRGVDAGHGDGSQLAHIAKTCAQKYQTTVALSGATDYISDGDKLIAVHNGTPLFPKITASGCLLGVVCGAFLAVHDDTLLGVLDAVLTYTIAGELASDGLGESQSGTFYTKLIDKLGEISEQDVQKHARFDVV